MNFIFFMGDFCSAPLFFVFFPGAPTQRRLPQLLNQIRSIIRQGATQRCILGCFQSHHQEAFIITRRIPIWVFPKIGVPPNHPILIGFSIINTIHFGVPPNFWKHPYLSHFHRNHSMEAILGVSNLIYFFGVLKDLPL